MMSRRCVLLALIAATVVALPTAPASAAEEPAGARVNICGAGAGTIGVRVTAPYRGEDLAPWVRISIEYYSSEDGSWQAAASGDSGWFKAGEPGTGSDTGYTFPYLAPRPGYRLVMRGVAQIQWRGPRPQSTDLTTEQCEVKSEQGTGG